MRFFKRVAFWLLACLVAAYVLLIVNEIVIFSLSDEVSARKAAEVAFIDECARKGIDPKVFNGPIRIYAEGSSFSFTWRNPKNGDTINALVNYLPFGTEAWFWKGDELR